MAQGIILAGGYSSRANGNKMGFMFDGKPLIMHTIEAMRPFVNKIFVITGHYDKDIREILKEEKDIEIVFNTDYPNGMFTSVLCGVSKVEDDFFIIPGDIPFIRASTYDAILKGKAPVRYPTYQGKEGHPLFIKHELKEALLREGTESNLRLFRDKQDKEAIPVDDRNILVDIDTIEDYIRTLEERN